LCTIGEAGAREILLSAPDGAGTLSIDQDLKERPNSILSLGVMTRRSISRSLEYAILDRVTGLCACIGSFGGQPIHEFVKDQFGGEYEYVGAAPRMHDGTFDPAALRVGEFILPPGLIYRMQIPDELTDRLARVLRLK
jgi:hypothetical protein